MPGQQIASQSVLLSLVLCLAAPSLLLHGQINPETAKSTPFEIVLKEGLPLLGFKKVVYSPDEHYAALGDNTQIVIYDLSQTQELRRITVPGLGIEPATFAFAHKTSTLYVRNGSSLLKCDLEDASDCKTLRGDVGGPFILSQDDFIAYISIKKIPVLLDANENRTLGAFADTVPAADREDFSWSQLAFYEEAGHPVKLLLAGEIDRGDEAQTPEEWHTSLFNLQTEITGAAYTKLPLRVDSSDFDARGNPLFCGTANKDAVAAVPPRSVYSMETHDFLNSSKMNPHFPQAIESCLDGEVPSGLSLMIASQPSAPAQSTYKFGILSPKKDLVLYTQQTSTTQTILFLGHPGSKKPAEMLAGSSALTTGIEFIRDYPAILIHGVGSQLWDMTSGQVKTASHDGRLSVDHKITAIFLPHIEANKPSGADLWLQDNTSNSPAQTSLHLSKMPSWYGVSATGDAVVYEIPPTTYVHDDGSSRSLPDGKLQVFINGITKDVPCNWRDGRATQASIDPSGTVFSAICDRPDTSSETGRSPFLVRWQLPSLQEMEPIPVQHSLMGASLSGEEGTATLCYHYKLQVVNLSTKAVTDIPDSLFSEEQIQDCQIQKDGHTIVLAVRDTSGDRIEWIDTKDITANKSIPLGLILSLTTDENGKAAVLTNDGIVSVFDRSGVRLARLVPVASQDWLAFSDTGFFDGTPNAIKWAAYRASPSSPLVPVSTLFNELYTPGLFSLVVAGQVPHLPDGLSLATMLELPGAKLLLQTGGATPTLLDGKAVICFSRADVFQSLRQGPNLVADDTSHPNCQDRMVLSDQANPQLTISALEAIKNNRFATPWDDQQLPSTGTIHLLTIAVGEYTHIEEPAIPTAVPAVENLETLIKSRFAADNLVDWDQICGALRNAVATKSAILGCVDKMIPKVKSDDMVVLIFAGHGGTVGQSELFYFYPADVATSSDGLDNAISSAEFADRVRYLQARRLVVIMDACDSGAVMPPIEGAFAARLREALAIVGHTPDAANPTGASGQGALLMAASAAVEEAIGGKNVNPFLDRLQDVLTPKNGHSVLANDIASKMSAPLLLKPQDGSPITITPVAIHIGANFAVTKP
jgi:Caspase domain